ncbi:MAG: hypothetical protein C5B53_12685 [Candidatus Melainabacteria bacterium]|nr:MAG: hypothetical protein C5B53_12685 [Candidatus Melainabacteria bacterium]
MISNDHWLMILSRLRSKTAALILALMLVTILPAALAEDNTKPSVYYTTTVIKVPNQTKYPPYKGPAIRDTTSMLSRPRLRARLTGEVDSEDQQDPPNEGCSPAAELLLRNPFPLTAVKTKSIPTQLFRQWILKTNRNLPGKQLRKESVVVVKGKWDHAEHVLEACGIPFLLLDPNKFQDKLPGAQVLIVNCPGDIGDTSLTAIRAFVKRGGYLLTTDWALASCLEPAFPHFACWVGEYSGSEIVDAEVVEPGNELARATVSQAPWKLDDKSQIVKLINYSKVDVLVRSRALSKEDGMKLGILALTFNYGQGRVLHLVGHFDNNSGNSALPDPAPSIQISLRQALSLNFIMDGLGASVN